MTHFYLIILNGEEILVEHPAALYSFLNNNWVTLRNEWNINMRLVTKVREISKEEYIARSQWER